MRQKAIASKKKGTSAPGWRIPDARRAEFKEWCRRHQRGYEKELAKALFLWIREGSAVRDLVERSIAGDPLFGPEFWRQFVERCDACALGLQKQLREKELRPTGVG
jgi:hypothetical protein